MKKLFFLAILGLASSGFYAKNINSVNKLDLSTSKKALLFNECNLYTVYLSDGRVWYIWAHSANEARDEAISILIDEAMQQ